MFWGGSPAGGPPQHHIPDSHRLPEDPRAMSEHHTLGQRIDHLLDVLWTSDGTDLLLTAGVPPLCRVNGELCPLPDQPPLTADDTEALVEEILTDEQRAARGGQREYDFAFGWRNVAR